MRYARGTLETAAFQILCPYTLCANNWWRGEERQIVFPAGLSRIIRHQRIHAEGSRYEHRNHRNGFDHGLHLIRYGVIQPQAAKPQEAESLRWELTASIPCSWDPGAAVTFGWAWNDGFTASAAPPPSFSYGIKRGVMKGRKKAKWAGVAESPPSFEAGWLGGGALLGIWGTTQLLQVAEGISRGLR